MVGPSVVDSVQINEVVRLTQSAENLFYRAIPRRHERGDPNCGEGSGGATVIRQIL